ncbi:hypothetical protein [Bradyrhizobium elkanii]|uniref:hypothetical protein n=1 Tax=Bradyrhizobium elkanii TaxID=29448 RepID=UPI001AE10E34|nr:hypothetical protein [Bradyrhizobium elkanii]MBP2426698.1 hypothetical protein [Bradyrhizobium elkanii]WLA95537.1 hypothetical protein QNJ96_20655 [Bradyrhizobium elkanii]
MTASGGQDSRKNHARICASKALFALSSGLPYRIYDCASTPDWSGQKAPTMRAHRAMQSKHPSTTIAHDLRDHQRSRLPAASLFRMTKKAPFRAPFDRDDLAFS